MAPIDNGLARFTFGAVPQENMLVAFDGNRRFADQPYFVAFLESPDPTDPDGGFTKRTTAISRDTVPGWQTDLTGEYILRQDTTEGGIKFGRIATPPGTGTGGAFVFSSWVKDTSLGTPVDGVNTAGRSELMTYGPYLNLPIRRGLWIAARCYLDFQQGPNEWVTIFQIKPAPSTAPVFSVSIYGSRIQVVRCWNPSDDLPLNYLPTEGVDRFSFVTQPGGADPWMRKWFDLCVHINIDLYRKGGGFSRVYFNGVDVRSEWKPIGFGGLTADGRRRDMAVRWGNYPNPAKADAWMLGKREVLIRRAFVAADPDGAPPFGLNTIRQALQA